MSDVQSLLLYHAFFAKLWSPAAERIRVANENFAGLQQGAAQPGNYVAGGAESQSRDGALNGKYSKRADINALQPGNSLSTPGSPGIPSVLFLFFSQKRLPVWATAWLGRGGEEAEGKVHILLILKPLRMTLAPKSLRFHN